MSRLSGPRSLLSVLLGLSLIHIYTACAAWSIRKEQWYDRTLVFESAGVDLRADALK